MALNLFGDLAVNAMHGHMILILKTDIYAMIVWASILIGSSSSYFLLTFDLFWRLLRLYVMLCAIWYYLYNFKNVKNTHGGVILLVKLQAEACTKTLLKLAFLHECFSRFLNCINGTKSRKASHIWIFAKSKSHD